MTSRWLSRVVVTTAIVGASTIAGASAAWANSTISINDGNVPTTAAEYEGQECSANQGGGPYADKDVWVFVLPGEHGTTGDFVSVTANFDNTGDSIADVTKVIDTDGGGFLNGGPAAAKAYIATPLGWTLISATAEITGEAAFFNLTHTCPASGTKPPTSPSPEPSSSATPTPSVSTSTVPSPSTTPDEPDLPVTGTAITGIVLTGLALIGGGTALLLARRRRTLSAGTPIE